MGVNKLSSSTWCDLFTVRWDERKKKEVEEAIGSLENRILKEKKKLNEGQGRYNKFFYYLFLFQEYGNYFSNT